ncbi:hypothetical protein MTR62_08495 [Novosphingobium sp. 1949]|uniref:Glycosyl transferase n=1 Tax=Novosphingobium organovorum TaxID=2930092 RepID=A0ABT0BCF5_9SPHN|nr:hypothetical protein [Novosphingobium organovorum]MCJ2182728.1 hypothetical protein [Novosphingobium organovorum]
MTRICFLFNHDQTHQIAHSLPIALAIARAGFAQVTLAVTDPVIARSVRALAGADLERCELVTLGLTQTVSRLLQRGFEGLIPARKLLIYRDNLDFFRRFDALVVSEKTSLLLKTRYGLDDLKIIHTRHGAGDRAIGFGKESARFDLVLVAGPKIARRLIAEAGVAPERIRVVGYSKFDLCADNRVDLGFADPARPSVLYNPHPSPRLSSWYAMGPALLEAFAASGEFNLVFAPHVMMFARTWTLTISPPALRRMHPPAASLSSAPNLRIDLGSKASTDMSYTNSADVYIGDVSSQVYEFLYHPRPCLFLDAHRTAWEGDPDYAHWRAGPVVRPGTDILAAVREAIASHPRYRPVQDEMLADTFSVTGESAALRGAKAIAQFLAGQPTETPA